MAALGWPARCLLTGLHVCGGLAAGGSLLAVLLQWAQNVTCIPPVIDGYGDPLSGQQTIQHACDVITYSTGVVCGLSILLALTLNACWGTYCWVWLHQLLTLFMCVMATATAAAITTDFMLWCQSLERSIVSSKGCQHAAIMFDEIHHTSNNMTVYFRKLELQQVCQWAVVPLTLISVVVYTIIIRKISQPEGHALEIRGRYYILHPADQDELAPLIQPTTEETNGNLRQLPNTPVPNAVTEQH